MYILTLRTDQPEAEIGLYSDKRQVDYRTWLAHRQLAETIHLKISELVAGQKLDLKQLGGVVIFQGPGSFTGLRIGITVANALADSLAIPIIGAMDPDLIQTGLARLLGGEHDKAVVPEYGALPNITAPRK